MAGFGMNVVRFGGLASLAVGLSLAPACASSIPGSIRRCSRPPRRKARWSSIPRPTSRKACRCSRSSRTRPASRSQYVRAADSQLMARMSIEFRADQKAWDIMQTTTLNKMPPAACWRRSTRRRPRTSRPRRAIPSKRWYGVYANYNSPAYNTKQVKASRTAEDLRGLRPAQGMGRQGRDRRHRQRMAQGDLPVLRRAEGPQPSSRTSWRRSSR